MATTYNITHKKGDTFNGREFQLTTYDAYTNLAAFPTTGDPILIYKALDTGLFYKWITDEYVLTTDKVYIDLTGCSILLQLRRTYDSQAALSMSSGEGITISDATHGIFRIDSQIIDIPAFVYMYDIQITSASNVVSTYISGTWTITGDVSRYV